MAHRFSHRNQKFLDTPGSGLSLHVVKTKFAELVFERETTPNEQVQLMCNCLCCIASENFYSCVRRIAASSDETFALLETRLDSKQHCSQVLTCLNRLTFTGIKSERQCSAM